MVAKAPLLMTAGAEEAAAFPGQGEMEIVVVLLVLVVVDLVVELVVLVLVRRAVGAAAVAVRVMTYYPPVMVGSLHSAVEAVAAVMALVVVVLVERPHMAETAALGRETPE